MEPPTRWMQITSSGSPGQTPLLLIPLKIIGSKIELLESPPSKSLLALSRESLHSLADAILMGYLYFVGAGVALMVPFLYPHSNHLTVLDRQPASTVYCLLARHHQTSSEAALPHLHCSHDPTRGNRHHNPHRGYPLSIRLKSRGWVTFLNPKSLKYLERQLKRQPRTRARLNNKVHLLHRGTPSRQGERAVSHNTQKQTQSSKLGHKEIVPNEGTGLNLRKKKNKQ